MNQIWIYSIVLILGVLVVFMPKKAQEFLSDKSSLQHWGMRYSNWRRDYIDTLTNFFLFLCFFGSMGLVISPYGKEIFMGIYFIAFVLLISQTYRISQKMESKEQRLLYLAIYVMCAIAFLAATLFMSYPLQNAYKQFLKDIDDQSIYSILYWFTHVQPTMLIHQFVCYFAAFYVVWAQFKYMRLENHYKAVSLTTFWVKVIIVSFVLVAISLGFMYLVKFVYYL